MSQTETALIVLCKCGVHQKVYGIRAEMRGKNNWLLTWAFPIKESSAKREGYDRSSIKGNVTFSKEFPGCPYCGEIGWTLCTCGHLSCIVVKNNFFTCEWCGKQGQIGEYKGETINAGMDL